MSKTVKTALTVALTLILTGACLVAVALLNGANLRELAESGQFSINVVDPAFHGGRGYQVCQSGTEHFAADEVKRLDISWVSGSVTVKTGGSELRLEERCEKPMTDEQKLCWKLENGTLTVRYSSATRVDLPKKALTLTVPEGWVAQSAVINAVSAGLELRGVAVDGDLTLDTTSGAIRAEDCRCRELEANTVSGEICLRCEAEEIEMSSTSGAMTAEGIPAHCDLSASSVSGKIRLSLEDAENRQRVTVSTTSGDVTLRVPGAIELDFDSVSGKVRGGWQAGSGLCPSVEVDTVSGNLTIEQ